MKEIDINIEGYNVNGICVGCLNYKRKMFYRPEVKDCFKLLGDIDIPDGLSVQVCWECLAYINNMLRFQTQIKKSYEILINYSRKNPYLVCSLDFTEHAFNRLSVSGVPCELEEAHEYQKDEKPEVEVEIKDEMDNEMYEVEIDVPQPVKEEDETLNADDNHYSEDYSQDAQSSEDDLLLSKLKEKKEKVKKSKRGRKKKSEKLIKKESQPATCKSFPSTLVTVVTMNEMEMWNIRAQDLASEEFSRLRFKCENCMITFNTEKLMMEHLNGKHQTKGEDCHQCDVCKAYFVTKDHLSSHRALHLKCYVCQQCGYRCCVRRLMRSHLRRHQPAEGLVCALCGDMFPTRSKLSYHRSKHHKEKLQCDCCGKVFASKMTLKYHLKLQTQNKEDKPKEKLFIPCKDCPKVFHSKKSYRAHVVIHNGLTYPCPICGKLFQWKRNLARHTRNHRERDAGALHECRECGKSFSSRDCYNNHMRLSKRHVPEDAYVHECNYCGKKFATKWCMVDHIDWDHLKRIKYQCSVCFKPFKTAKIMVAHMNNIHEGKRNKEPDGEHLCEVCGKSYKTVKRLKGHVWSMHTNRSTSKSFKCKLCPATFTWQTSIYKHMKMMHDSGKRAKQARAPPKKLDQYSEMELGRLHYFPPAAPPAQVPHILHT